MNPYIPNPAWDTYGLPSPDAGLSEFELKILALEKLADQYDEEAVEAREEAERLQDEADEKEDEASDLQRKATDLRKQIVVIREAGEIPMRHTNEGSFPIWT